ncbi:MAG: hypothetical protein ABII13_02415 [Patescibacteria group bacterium]|nr:hypothetical protein [Patescibacteria group bacterium]
MTQISTGQIEDLLVKSRSGQITDQDLDAFLKRPKLWQDLSSESAAVSLPTPENAQEFWQGVYGELGIKVEVPPLRRLTPKQKKSLTKFGFMLVYISEITEAEYPASFVKPDWGSYITASSIERMPLKGAWVAVETIRKSDRDDLEGYPDDRLLTALGRNSRFRTSHDCLTSELLVKIAKTTGFPKKGTGLPTVEQWNFVANLFNWLREHRGLDLPDLGSTRSWEWCQNVCGSERRLLVGRSARGGLADVSYGWRALRSGRISFRVLVVL